MGWGTDAHGVVGRVLWYCSGRLQVHRRAVWKRVKKGENG
nr:hypothetical protein [Tanacetum cinerariifolium]